REAVVPEIGDAIAGADAVGAQTCGEASDQGVQFVVADLAALIVHRDDVGMDPRVSRDLRNRADVDVSQKSSSLRPRTATSGSFTTSFAGVGGVVSASCRSMARPLRPRGAVDVDWLGE